MDSILTELHKSNQSCTTANNQLELRGKQRPPGLSRDQVIDGSVKNFRTLETQVATVLPSAWVYFGAQMGYEGRRHIEETSKSKDGLHAAITAFEAGRNEPGTNAEGLLAKIRAAATTLAKSITSLRDLCLARGVASQTGW